jgi:Ala-tRNA(Pro) deacylase
VTLVVDEALMRADPVNFHPLVNSATTGLARADLLKFFAATGHAPRIMRLPEPPAQNCGAPATTPSSA